MPSIKTCGQAALAVLSAFSLTVLADDYRALQNGHE